MTRVLFVCTGNICRSPTAEGIARALAETAGRQLDFDFDSAGTLGFHAGEAPDPRAQQRAALRGYDLSSLRARKVTDADFERFDLILAMDRDHLSWLKKHGPAHLHYKLELFMSPPRSETTMDVPDPYYGRDRDFDEVLDLCEIGVRRLIAPAMAPGR